MTVLSGFVEFPLNPKHYVSCLAAVLIRLSILQGCDASVLLASPNAGAEKDHPDDISLAGDGFDTVIKAKAAIDSDSNCRNKVSCADILAMATRDVVALVNKISSCHNSTIFCFF